VKIRDERGKVYEIPEEEKLQDVIRWGKWYRKGKHRFALKRDGKRVYLFWNGLLKIFEMVLDTYHEEDRGTTTSPITGKITSIRVRVGDRVERGQPILTIESMKMETVIEAPHGGIVKKLYHSEGDLVNQGEILFEIEEE